MPQWIACIIAYNEEQLLPMCLDSIRDKVDRIALVEGKLATFPGDNLRSTDRTIEIARNYGCEIITQDTPYVTEIAMRNNYLIGKPGDWYIHIDADEKLMTPLPDIDTLPDGIDAYAVNIRMIGAPTSVCNPRIFRHIEGMGYRQRHELLFAGDRLISNPAIVPKLHSVWFAHYQMWRSEQRRKLKYINRQNRVVTELELQP